MAKTLTARMLRETAALAREACGGNELNALILGHATAVGAFR